MINYQNNKPFVEGVAIEDIASSHTTPMYVYSQKKIEEKYNKLKNTLNAEIFYACLLYTSPSPRDRTRSRMPSSA